MPRRVVLLRGVNLGRRNRIAMAPLRAALEAQGFRDVQTYLQSGNILLTSRASSEGVEKSVRELMKKRYGLEIVVLSRSWDELARVVSLNPLAEVAVNPRRYLVTFLSGELPQGFVDGLSALADQERFAIVGREVYSWHPDGVGRSPLWERLAAKSMDIAGTSRNWATVTALLGVADSSTAR